MNLLSRYTLLERIGNSVLGTVYKAQDKANGSLVTLRVLQLGLLDEASRRELESRLQRDFEAADRLQHPGIARVLELRREGHTALIASELVDGPTVTSFVRASGGSELSQVVTAVGQMLEALDFAHRLGVIHRDLRPANVRVQGERIKVSDFGMADLGAGGRDDTASVGDRTEYMAPEQFESGTIDKRCDIHAAGVILYELLTGRSPFAGEADGLTAMFRVMNHVPLPPSQVRPGLAPAFDRVVQRALAKKPEERFATAQQFRDELRNAYAALMRRPPPDTLVRSVFAAQYPPAPAPAPRTATNEASSLTSPLPEELLSEKSARAQAPSPAPAKAATAASRPAPAPDPFVSGNTLPGSTATSPSTATSSRGVTSRSARSDSTAARASEAPKAAPAPEPPKPAAAPPSDREKSARRSETRMEAAPVKPPEAKKPAPPAAPPPPVATTSSDLGDLLRGAVPLASASEESARAKEPQSPPVSGGTVLTSPKRAAAKPAEVPRPSAPEPPPPAPPKRPDKEQPAGGTALTPPKRPAAAPIPEAVRAAEPEKPRVAPSGTVFAPAKPAAAAAFSDPGSLVAQAVPVESVLAKPAEPTPRPQVSAPAEKVPEKPAERVAEPESDVVDPAAEAALAKQFERTIWLPTPKDDSGLYRGPPPPKPAAPATPPAATPPPAAPPQAALPPAAAAPVESPPVTPPPKPHSIAPRKPVPLTDAAIAHGGKVLARFMGPIAMVLSRRAAQETHDEKAFFDALAAHLNDPDERYQFLREVRQRPSP